MRGKNLVSGRLGVGGERAGAARDLLLFRTNSAQRRAHNLNDGYSKFLSG